MASSRLASRSLGSRGQPLGPSSRSVEPVDRDDPGGELDRRPVVLGAAERDEHRPVGPNAEAVLSRHEHGHVAGRWSQE